MILYGILDWFVCILRLEATEEEEDGGGFAGDGLFLVVFCDNIGDATARTVFDAGSQVEVVKGVE